MPEKARFDFSAKVVTTLEQTLTDISGPVSAVPVTAGEAAIRIREPVSGQSVYTATRLIRCFNSQVAPNSHREVGYRSALAPL